MNWRAGLETIVVESGLAVALPSLATEESAASSGSAGDTRHFFDGAQQDATALSASASMVTLQQATSKRQAARSNSFLRCEQLDIWRLVIMFS